MKKHLFIRFMAFPIFFLLIPVIIALLFTRPAPINIANLPKSTPTQSSIFVLDTKTNTLKEVYLEEYLVGVLAGEMPASYEFEALKAQAVAARTFIMNKALNPSPDHLEGVVCNNPSHCKAHLSDEEISELWHPQDSPKYLEKIKSAVTSTKGEYMISEDEVIEAFFFASSGGKTENSSEVWGEERSYLKSVSSEGDLSNPRLSETTTIPKEQFWSTLKAHNSAVSGDNIGKITHTEGGSIKKISLGGQDFEGTDIRKLFNLKSSNFNLKQEDNNMVFTTLGNGHGVGMSQFGANFMAKNGAKYTEILSHYYTNIQIVKD